DLLGRLFGDLLDLDAAFRTHHQHEALARTIEHETEIQLALDLQALLDQHAADPLTVRPRLVRDQIHAEHLFRRRTRVGWSLHDLHAAALAAAARVNLRLDDNGAAEAFGDRGRISRVEDDFAVGHGHAVARKNRLRLVLVNLHQWISC